MAPKKTRASDRGFPLEAAVDGVLKLDMGSVTVCSPNERRWYADRQTREQPLEHSMQGQPSKDALTETLARLSAHEMVCALGLANAPRVVQTIAGGAFFSASRPLGRVLARFEARIDAVGLPGAAAAALTDLGARWVRQGDAAPGTGPLLVVANHPGAYDALVLLAALGRQDVAVIAADRPFLRALPSLARRMFFVPEGQGAVQRRALGLRHALRHLRDGGAVLHFGAGQIEPDPAFSPAGIDVFAPWGRGTGALVRHAKMSGARVLVAVVAGVHSARAKRLWVIRMAESRGLTTLAPLLQVAVRRYRKVEATVTFDLWDEVGAVTPRNDDGDLAARLRARAGALLGH